MNEGPLSRVVQILLVDDNLILRQALRALLEREPDFTICGEADTASAALEQAAETQPDLVLIDVFLPDRSGIDLARMLRQRLPDVTLAMLSGHRDKHLVDYALDAGAVGYILKGRAAELPRAIRQVMRGERYLSPEIDGSGLASGAVS